MDAMLAGILQTSAKLSIARLRSYRIAGIVAMQSVYVDFIDVVKWCIGECVIAVPTGTPQTSVKLNIEGYVPKGQLDILSCIL